MKKETAAKASKASKPAGARKSQDKSDLVGGFPAKFPCAAAMFDPSGTALYVLRPPSDEGSQLVRLEADKPEVVVATVPPSSSLVVGERILVPYFPRGVCIVETDGRTRRIDVEEGEEISLCAVDCKGDLVAMLVDVGPGEPVGRRIHEVRMHRLDGSQVWSARSNDILFGSNGLAFSGDGSFVYTNQHDTTEDVATVMRWDTATGRLEVEKAPGGAGEILFVAPNGSVLTRPYSTVVHVHRPNFASDPNAEPLLVAKRDVGGFAGFDTLRSAVLTARDLFVLCGKGERSLLFRRPLDGSEGELVKCPLLPQRVTATRDLVAIVGFAQRVREARVFAIDGRAST